MPEIEEVCDDPAECVAGLPGPRLMLYTIVGAAVLVGTMALMAWLLWASFKAEDRRHLAELNEEYKELLQREGRQDW